MGVTCEGMFDIIHVKCIMQSQISRHNLNIQFAAKVLQFFTYDIPEDLQKTQSLTCFRVLRL